MMLLDQLLHVPQLSWRQPGVRGEGEIPSGSHGLINHAPEAWNSQIPRRAWVRGICGRRASFSSVLEVVFETERLLARPWRVDEDAEGAFEMYGDPEVVRYIGGELLADVATQRQRLAMLLERNASWGGGYGSWPLIEKPSGELVGTALLKPLPASGTGRQPSQDIEIGWHLVRRHWGRGFASEAGKALLCYGFEVLGLDRLHAVVDPDNARSLAVARRIGLRHTGKTTLYYDQELEHFELSARDFP
jgi:[ribosomal protein S5]-alanine N-acetyltransferase